MTLRTVMLLAGLVGGLLWVVRMVLSLLGTAEAAADGLAWGGLVLLAVALAGFGTELVSKGAVWLRAIVAVAFPLLVWSVLEALHPVGDPAVVDGLLGLVVLVVSVRRLVTARADRPGPRHGARAR